MKQKPLLRDSGGKFRTGSKTLEMAGLKFGKLTALRRNGTANDGSVKWICKCDCGKIKTVKGSALRSGHTKSCGCSQYKNKKPTRKYDLTGKKFNRLKVLCENGRTNTGQVRWACLCECGNILNVGCDNLKRGQTKSCGCARRKFEADAYLLSHGKRVVEYLSDGYVRKMLMNSGLFISKETIELKRRHAIFNRELKKAKELSNGTNSN